MKIFHLVKVRKAFQNLTFYGSFPQKKMHIYIKTRPYKQFQGCTGTLRCKQKRSFWSQIWIQIPTSLLPLYVSILGQGISTFPISIYCVYKQYFIYKHIYNSIRIHLLPLRTYEKKKENYVCEPLSKILKSTV